MKIELRSLSVAFAPWCQRRQHSGGSLTGTIDAGVASLREHRAHLDGLGGDFDPDEFLRNLAGYTGLGAGCEYAVGFRRYPMA